MRLPVSSSSSFSVLRRHTDQPLPPGRFHVDAQGHVGEYDIEQGPGYRVLELKDGGAFSSQVVRPEMREGLGQLSDLLSGPRLERRAVPSL